MMFRWLRVAGLVLFAALLTAAPVWATPPFPYEVYGTVQVNGENVPLDTRIGAWCGGVEYTWLEEVELYQGETWYALQVPGDDPATMDDVEGCTSQETVSFTITIEGDELWADQTGTWVSEQFDRLDLTAFRPLPSLDLEKHTDGQDADSAPGPYVSPGDTVAWTYTVTNTGNVTLTQVTVVDDPAGNASCPKDSLVVDESMTCSRSGTAVAGSYSNLGTATGIYASKVVSDTDRSHYFGAAPGIDLEKHTNGVDADSAPGPTVQVGQVVSWTYHVTNTGNVALSSVAVSDDQGVSVVCPGTTLTVGASMTCTASGVAVSGDYRNVGTARGQPPGGFAAVSDTDPSHYRGFSGIYLPLVRR